MQGGPEEDSEVYSAENVPSELWLVLCGTYTFNLFLDGFIRSNLFTDLY